MPDFYLKKGDTDEDLVRILQDDVGAVDLTGATVQFQMRPAADGSVTKVDAAATTQLGTTGQVTYQWQDGDVDESGLFYGEFKVTFANGKKGTFPNGEDYIEILIGEGVNDAP